MVVYKPVIGVAAAVIAGAGAWYFLQTRHAAAPSTPKSAAAR